MCQAQSRCSINGTVIAGGRLERGLVPRAYQNPAMVGEGHQDRTAEAGTEPWGRAWAWARCQQASGQTKEAWLRAGVLVSSAPRNRKSHGEFSASCLGAAYPGPPEREPEREHRVQIPPHRLFPRCCGPGGKDSQGCLRQHTI